MEIGDREGRNKYGNQLDRMKPVDFGSGLEILVDNYLFLNCKNVQLTPQKQ